MKPEPLKNKITCLGTSPQGNDVDICYTEDIKSAVEWLKIELHLNNIQSGMPYSSLAEIIDKAFEDVIKDE